ncbi:MAG: Pr6Pr family membrane protein [Bacteroidota bacterium]
MKSATKSTTIFATLGAFTCFYAVFSQYIIRLYNYDTPVWQLTLNHFSFFTILTNLLVGIFFTSQIFSSNNKWNQFFSNPNIATSITVYISLVGLIFNLLLRKTYHPSGIEGVNNNLLHVIIPLATIYYWYMCIRKERIKYESIYYWIIYPLCYVVYILVKGYFMHFYQYPFFDVDKLGYEKVILMALCQLVVLSIMSAIYIWINNRIATKMNVD